MNSIIRKRVFRPVVVMSLELFQVTLDWPDEGRERGYRREHKLCFAETPIRAAAAVGAHIGFSAIDPKLRPVITAKSVQALQPLGWHTDADTGELPRPSWNRPQHSNGATADGSLEPGVNCPIDTR